MVALDSLGRLGEARWPSPEATAETVGLPRGPVLGAQGFGAGVGNMIALHNIIAGGATVGLAGQEGAVLRRTLPICLAYTFLGGVIALVIVRSTG